MVNIGSRQARCSRAMMLSSRLWLSSELGSATYAPNHASCSSCFDSFTLERFLVRVAPALQHTVQGVCSYFHVEGARNAHRVPGLGMVYLDLYLFIALNVSKYYSCDATYHNWLKVELENMEVSPLELSVEEKQRAIAAAKETLNSSFSQLLRKENPWLVPTEDHVYESVEPLFLELHAIAMLCLPSGECMCPDATLCATLLSALYSLVSEEVVLNRQLMLSVSISSADNYCIEVVLRCLATDGDGLGPHALNDGGILATVIAAGFKGELARFQAGVTMEILRLDAWYSSKDGSPEGPATYIVRGLRRRCCIPEVILRCMQVSISLVELGNPPESHDELIELVASPETGFLHLFSQQQLQVSVSISSTDNYCIEVVLRCLATDGDGLGPHELNDGGILATVIAAGFKGELVRFQAGVTMEILQLDAWYSSKDGSPEGPATYIVRGLCRRCCIPEVILRCMQVFVSLVESGNPPESHDELIELVASPETGFLHLFSQQQLQTSRGYDSYGTDYPIREKYQVQGNEAHSKPPGRTHIIPWEGGSCLPEEVSQLLDLSEVQSSFLGSMPGYIREGLGRIVVIWIREANIRRNVEHWRALSGVEVAGHRGNFYIFRFASEADMHRVVAQGPYAVAGALLIIEYGRPNLVLEHLKILQYAV
ncbi:hypothetical protein TEA_001696 [Camellia sinensis var. sinensis]|uniref:DUF4283 domain-containing protein n=1 Tax=Camellia sinensis var. sinensis TaxID=542762 RepID=A0A4V3WJH8_CAMSN|nr:hypothetical protein TEA_001696 [Camellia sinensis var. sinensis]